ncbi:hypothetical protein N9R54_04140 [Pelobium sp.]|nr:hypothetical protein [Pelobium sp.]MDA9555403.1 hypothetical protein [Pelobium sp.]
MPNDKNTLFHLKDNIKSDLITMQNCLKAEQRRLLMLKNLVVSAEQYELCAKLRTIELKLTETLVEIENFSL